MTIYYRQHHETSRLARQNGEGGNFDLHLSALIFKKSMECPARTSSVAASVKREFKPMDSNEGVRWFSLTGVEGLERRR